MIHQDHDRGCQATQPWQTSNQARALATRKQTEPTASGRHTCRCAAYAVRSAPIATPVLRLKYTVPASWIAVACQWIRRGWKTKNRRRSAFPMARARVHGLPVAQEPGRGEEQ